MKKKRSILFSAVLAIAVCASLIAGTTYALFTSESSVNIAVTSGKVEVTATVGDPTVSVIEGSGVTTPNVSAKTVGNSVTLSGMTPGDKVDFAIAIDNGNTTVQAKYRISYIVETGYLLASGLNIVVDGITDGAVKYQSYASAWSDDIAKTVNVSIAMPNHANSKIDNLYMGLSTAIGFSVEAIQANAVTDSAAEYKLLPDNADALKAAEANNVVVMTAGESLAETLKNSAGKYVVLTEDTDLAGVSGLSHVTIDANGNAIVNDSHKLRYVTGTSIAIKNAVFNKGQGSDWGLGSRGISYYNCEFNDYAPYIDSTDDVVVDGCIFNNTTLQFCFNESKEKVLPNNTVITNNVFNINNTNSSAHAIVFAGGETEEWEDETDAYQHQKNIVVENNTFNPVYAEKTYVAYYIYGQAGVTLGSVRSFPDNTYNGLAAYAVNDITNQYDIATDANTVRISTAQELYRFAQSVNGGNSYKGKTIVLTSNINMADLASVKALADKGWTPIGEYYTSTKDCNPFSGTFDGKGYTVSNLKINLPEQNNVGLFGYMLDGAKVKNVTVENATVVGAKCVAVVVANYVCSIENCHVKGHIEVTGNVSVGGIAGSLYGNITDCSVVGDDSSFIKGVYDPAVEDGNNVGGIVGYAAEGSYSYKNLQVENIAIEGTRKVGGAIGYLQYTITVDGVSVTNVTVSSNASGDYKTNNIERLNVGGIIGDGSTNFAAIKNCVATDVIVRLPLVKENCKVELFGGNLSATDNEVLLAKISGCSASNVTVITEQ